MFVFNFLILDIVYVYIGMSFEPIMLNTSSLAVAKRPRDASCLSVVSFNSTKHRTDLSLRAIKCCSVVFGVTVKLLVINILPSFPAINKHRRLLPASVTTCGTVVRRRGIYNTWPTAGQR